MARWAVVAVLVAGWSPASAEITAEDKAAARQHFNNGKGAFELGRFADALREYEQAYKLAPLPGFLFNIGQCYRNLDNHEKAIFSFRLYLKKLPDAKNRAATETLIEELQQKAEEERIRKAQQANVPPYDPDNTRPPITDPPPIPIPRPPPGTPFYKQWWFWVPVSVVVVGATSIGTYYAVRPREAELPSSALGVWDLSR